VLLLELPPEHVDPNVHPTKSDVRLRYGSQVFDAVRRAIAATLGEHARLRLAQNTLKEASPAISFAPVTGPSGEIASQLLWTDGEAAADRLTDRVRVLGQLHRTYILASDGDALLLVDQHAAHERIAYEAIVGAARSGSPSQPLLVPHVVELDSARSAALDRALEILREGGLEIDTFGERTYRIVATPSGYRARPFDFAGLLDDLSDEPKQRDARERIWASLACHSVTIAGEQLAHEEMTSLLERLEACSNPMHCPHGRPTMVRLGREEIARMFKRA